MGKMNSACIVSVSLWDSLKIHFFSCVYGLWVLSKRLLKYLWNGNLEYSRANVRDSPPSCLEDSSIGQHKYVKLKGIKIHYVEAGERNNPLLLLLHGFPDFWLGWRHQIPVLAEDYRVVAMDLKGFGDSDKPQWRSGYRVDVILEELKQLISALGATNCTIVGHDLGALIGWYFVYKNPTLVTKFISISCPHPNMFWNTSSNQWLNCVQLPYLPEIDALKHDVRIISEYHKYLPENYLEAYKYTFSRKEDWTGPINYYRNLPFNKISEDNNESLEVYTVLITGSNDKMLGLEAVVKSSDYCEKVRVKIVDGAGHFPHQEKPEAFNEVLLKFLRKKRKLNKTPSQRLMEKMYGAVSSTVKLGNSVLDSVQKRSGVVAVPSIEKSKGFV
ncbi:epoxide hydrolase 4-like [Harmonia axyridis]|uniref:epoxide hydrolase 4-like n=1 Tax=Harmonia axyridis TaxID=115357 RepID=UPI001E278B80|nr:epoxide hydrolase 4-like [Harmonia axyridis]